jgi:putative membrane protein
MGRLSLSAQAVSYCGAPPTPDSLAFRWNLDPILIVLLVTAFAMIGVRARGRLSFGGGWAIAAAALVSPLCPLSVSLFSARVGQHMILEFVAAPLVALGCGWAPRGGAVVPASALAACLWLWHAPGPYDATFASPVIYWLMHLTTFGAAFWLWSALVNGRDLASSAVAILLTCGLMGLLGAVITFAPRPLYPVHELTTWAWGLSPLGDQQLGGVIMWVPAGLILGAGLTLTFTATLRRAARAT